VCEGHPGRSAGPSSELGRVEGWQQGARQATAFQVVGKPSVVEIRAAKYLLRGMSQACTAVARSTEKHTARADAVDVADAQRALLSVAFNNLPRPEPCGDGVRPAQTVAECGHRRSIPGHVVAEVADARVARSKREMLEARNPLQMVTEARRTPRADRIEDGITAVSVQELRERRSPKRSENKR